MPVKVGYIHGTGAALNVEIGFVPDYVKVIDLTDGTDIWEGFLAKVIVFTSLSNAIKAGDYIKGITSGATAQIRQVILDSGTIAGGDAAGWLICNAKDVVGTLETENADVYTAKPGSAAASANHLGIVVDVEFGVDINTEVAAVTGNAGFLSYEGTEATLRKGFTIGSTISEDGDLLGYFALANDPGMEQEPEVAGVKQSAGLW